MLTRHNRSPKQAVLTSFKSNWFKEMSMGCTDWTSSCT